MNSESTEVISTPQNAAAARDVFDILTALPGHKHVVLRVYNET